MTVLYEGQSVNHISRPSQGLILAVAGKDSVHVKWTTGPHQGSVTIEDVYDISPLVVAANANDDPLHLTAVRRSYDTAGEVGVLNFLASNNYLKGWEGLAGQILDYAEDLIRRDASMELPEEQLSIVELSGLVRTAALTLLKDAFGTPDTEV